MLTDSLANNTNSIAMLSPTKMDSLRSSGLVEWSNNAIGSMGVEGESLMYLRTGVLLVSAVLICLILWWLTRKILIEVIHRVAYKSKTKWDDHW